MNVIASAVLLVRRIKELQQRRQELLERQDRLRGVLPDWTFKPLAMVGMSIEEIRQAAGQMASAQTDAGLDDIEDKIEEIDSQIQNLENQMLRCNSFNLDGVQAMLDLAVDRLRTHTPTDPDDLFYDYGDAMVLQMLEHATASLRLLAQQPQRVAS